MTHTFIPNPSLRGTDPLDALRLIRSEQVGPMTFFHLVKFCGSVKKALEMAADLSRRGGRKKPIVIASKAEAEREYAALTKYGARLVLYGTEEYPRLLQFIPDAPPILTVRGHVHVFSHQKIVGIVGARNASANGCAFAKKLAGDLGAAGYTVVSGLARGVDAAAHRGSIATGTVAVIGGGIDNIYPPENASLYEEIAAAGAIISELPFGMAPHAKSFPARNRIIAGMSRGVAVIEASPKSGSLITAEYANDYGREVFAVPGSPMDPRCQGTNALIRQGATMIETSRDVISNLSPIGALPLAESDFFTFAEADAPMPPEDALVEARRTVVAALSFSPAAMDDVLAASGTTTSLLMVALLELELAGRLERHPGGKVSLRVEE